MLKHAIQHHDGRDPQEVRFHMRVLQYHKSAFERQIDEAVKIQTSRKTSKIMNSKSEYNRSSIPRLGLKMGHKSFSTKSELELENEKDEEEKATEEKIRQMKN
jgi:hypothetical protein